MLKIIDDFLNVTTMYRLVLYVLIALIAIASLFGFAGLVPYTGFAIIFSALFIAAVTWLTNTIFAETFKVTTNLESVYITALILALIVKPAQNLPELFFTFWVGVLAISSKYIVALFNKHLFNPVALAVFIASLFLSQSAIWWVGNLPMLIPVLIGGFLIVRKIRRWGLVLSFLAVATATIFSATIIKGTDLITSIDKTLIYSPLFFFAALMLTEPLTTPPTKNLRLVYGALVGFLFAPQIHLGSIYTTPELALLIGNVFSYLVSPKKRLVLTLKEKNQISPDVTDFIFDSQEKFVFKAGQYMEWTMKQHKIDSRGNRRYFTLASSPTEKDILLGVKYYPNPSSFKKSLFDLKPGDKIVASQLAGDFTLPDDPTKKLVFIAGGIGITPFRSMFKYLLDTNQKRNITLLFVNKNSSEIVYMDIFKAAYDKLGIKTYLSLTDTENLPPNWQGGVGRLDATKIQELVPDYKDRIFYISGSHAMVTGSEETLKQLQVPGNQIKTDYFPGLV